MTLDVRAWNVLFGDAVLISWDENDRKHHAFVDFGNHPGDANASFQDVYDDVRDITKGDLDLVIVTHRHMDHLEGFYTCRDAFARDFTIDRLWHAHVAQGTDAVFELAGQRVRQMTSRSDLSASAELGSMYQNNFGALGLTTKDRMDKIEAELGVPTANVFQVHRQLDLAATSALPPGMNKMHVEVLAPEQDSTIYLTEEVHAMSLAANAVKRSGGGGDLFPWKALSVEDSDFAQLADFARLRRRIRAEADEILAAVDKTRNNTSVVTKWTYEGVKLLMTGDAETRSWEVMKDNVDLSADLIKVAHHGSHNASPPWCFDKVFPNVAPINRVLLSTDPSRFNKVNKVPDGAVIDGWRDHVTKKSRLKRTDDHDVGRRTGFRFSVG